MALSLVAPGHIGERLLTDFFVPTRLIIVQKASGTVNDTKRFSHVCLFVATLRGYLRFHSDITRRATWHVWS